jgi:hypothetical protein
VPEDGKLKIELFGELGALLALGLNHKLKHPRADATGVQVTLVAGAPCGFVTKFRWLRG